jgi:hypothetical protein
VATYNKYQIGVTPIVTVGNAATDQYAIALTNSVNAATDTTMTPGSYDLPTGGGYTAGGVTCSVVSTGNSGGTYNLVLSVPSPTWTATNVFGPFRYIALYDKTLSSNNLIGYWDYGASVLLNAGDQFTVILDNTNGVFQVT